MTVLNFPDRRSATPDDGLLTCGSCGGNWFELCTVDADGTKYYGAVVLAPDGRVTGYSGVPHCLDCGQLELPDPGMA